MHANDLFERITNQLIADIETGATLGFKMRQSTPCSQVQLASFTLGGDSAGAQIRLFVTGSSFFATLCRKYGCFTPPDSDDGKGCSSPVSTLPLDRWQDFVLDLNKLSGAGTVFVGGTALRLPCSFDGAPLSKQVSVVIGHSSGDPNGPNCESAYDNVTLKLQ